VVKRLRILQDSETARLAKENPGVRWNPDDWCPTCLKNDVDDYKNSFYKHDGKVVQCDCYEQMMLFKHYSLAGIGKSYHRLDWRDYARSTKLKAKVNQYVERHQEYVDRGLGLLFTGPVGTGKTMLANLVLKDLVKLGYKCHAAAAQETTNNMTATWRSIEEKRRFEDIYERSEVLLLDDVGRDLINDRTGEVSEEKKFKENILDSILRKRVQYGRPTFITTNLSTGELLEGYGQAVHSLLTEKTIVVPLVGEDFRPNIVSHEIDEAERGERSPIR
jgi:DNA replication protein DnaC